MIQEGETPLIRAVKKQHIAMVSMLIEKGAMVSALDGKWVKHRFWFLKYHQHRAQLNIDKEF